MANCSDMADAWQRLEPEWMLWVATRPGVLTDRELRLFAVFCARQVEHLLSDQRSKDAIDTAEKFANGEATREELAAARDAAWDATWGAARAAARAAARDAARDAAYAARDAAGDAAGAAARDAVRDAQSGWLRASATPNFGIDFDATITADGYPCHYFGTRLSTCGMTLHCVGVFTPFGLFERNYDDQGRRLSWDHGKARYYVDEQRQESVGPSTTEASK